MFSNKSKLQTGLLHSAALRRDSRTHSKVRGTEFGVVGGCGRQGWPSPLLGVCLQLGVCRLTVWFIACSLSCVAVWYIVF